MDVSWLLKLSTAFVMLTHSYGAEDCVRSETMSTTPESRLVGDLMCGYERDQRPVRDHRSTVNVTVRLNVKYISFTEHEESLAVRSWLSMKWTDEYLSWDPKNYGDLKEIQLKTSTIWQPRLALYNSNSGLSGGDIFTSCIVMYTGVVVCVPPVNHDALCSSRLRNWPYDTQNCTLRFGSWLHSGEQINFTFSTPSGVYYEDSSAGPGWRLDSVTCERTPGKYECCPSETFPSLLYHFVLHRHVAGPAALIVSPAVVVTVVSVASLLLDVNDYTRLALSCFSLLGHLLVLAQIAYSIPKHSAETPVILLFVRDSMVLSMVGVLLTLVFSGLKRRVDQPHPLVSKITSFVYGRTRFAIYTAFEPSIIPQKDLPRSSEDESREASIRAWTDFCNILNTVSFIIIITVYLILLTTYLPRDD